jgi:hypothetical protein
VGRRHRHQLWSLGALQVRVLRVLLDVERSGHSRDLREWEDLASDLRFRCVSRWPGQDMPTDVLDHRTVRRGDASPSGAVGRTVTCGRSARAVPHDSNSRTIG